MDLLSSLRLTLDGTRRIVCARASDLIEFMAEENIDTGALNLSKVCQCFLKLSLEQLQKFCKKHALYHATTASGDLFYMPHAFIFADRAMAMTDNVGVCCRGVVAKD
eukprot:4051360-Lingulodinium_polyedra.AAC.1